MLCACATLFLNIKGQGKLFSDVWMIAALQRRDTIYRILWLNTYYSRLIRRTKCYATHDITTCKYANDDDCIYTGS
jgi:hypothetical protein